MNCIYTISLKGAFVDTKVSKIKEIELDEKVRFKTNIDELDRVYNITDEVIKHIVVKK